jgi:nucleoside-triphosphatase THEP1
VIRPQRPPAAILGSQAARPILTAFANALAERGFSVAGVVQATQRDAQGRKVDMALVDVTTGQGRSFSQRLGQGSQSCTVDEQALCETAGALAQALHQGRDLVIFSKFGHLEVEGRGFRQEFAEALAAGIPVLCTVPPDVVGDWLAFTGGRGQVLAADPALLWRWWGAHALYADLAHAAAVHPLALSACCEGVTVVPLWVLFEGPSGCGLAPLDGVVAESLDGLIGRPLAEMAQALPLAAPNPAGGGSKVTAWHGALGLAALNALMNGGAAAEPAEAASVVVDRPVGLGWRDATTESLLLPAQGLADYRLPMWLEGLDADVTHIGLSGVAAPLCDRLAAYGFSQVAGVVVTDPIACAEAILDPDCTEAMLAARGSVGKRLQVR